MRAPSPRVRVWWLLICRQVFQRGSPAIKISCLRRIASGDPNPLGEIPLFLCGLSVQQPHVFVAGYGVLHGSAEGARARLRAGYSDLLSAGAAHHEIRIPLPAFGAAQQPGSIVEEPSTAVQRRSLLRCNNRKQCLICGKPGGAVRFRAGIVHFVHGGGHAK
jgi:hypothetical protein